jgi:hypothetical protein
MGSNPFIHYYIQQSGGQFSPVVFQGYKYQRGRGFGSFFSSLFRRISPFLKTVGADIGKTLLNTGSHLIDDAVIGRNFKESARDRFSSAGKDILNQSINTIKSQVGLGRKRKLSTRKRNNNKKRKVVRKPSRKRRNPKNKKKNLVKNRKILTTRQLFG